ncbi:MAG TPA: hypothetical protein VHM90_05770 [Phycisphaerae bacterium]|nr:hypothetical protein [Phycisphaerae bacterium]
MRKMPAVALALLIGLMIGSATPHSSNAQTGGGARVTGASGEDMPHRTAKAFAPFIRAVIARRMNNAAQLFKLRRSVQTYLEQAETVQILGRFVKPDRLNLNLVGGRTLGENIGVLFFTVAHEEGPVAFKIYYYGVGDDIYIARMDIMDGWDEIEAAAISVEALNAPIVVNLGGAIDETGGG